MFYVRLLPDVFISEVVQPSITYCNRNIIISAEFCLLSSAVFCAPHSERYVIARLMMVSMILSFNSTGIFLLHITPDTSFHFIHPIVDISL